MTLDVETIESITWAIRLVLGVCTKGRLDVESVPHPATIPEYIRPIVEATLRYSGLPVAAFWCSLTRMLSSFGFEEVVTLDKFHVIVDAMERARVVRCSMVPTESRLLEKILDEGSGIDVCDEDVHGNTVLQYHKDRLGSCVRVFVERGAPLETADRLGVTALQVC
jgi:hypothetical protein